MDNFRYDDVEIWNLLFNTDLFTLLVTNQLLFSLILTLGAYLKSWQVE